MASDGYNADSNRIPSYEEAMSGNKTLFEEGNAKRDLSLQQQILITRKQRVQAVVDDQVEPLLDPSNFDGVSGKMFILVPSDALEDAGELSGQNIVGDAAAASSTVLRLRGDDNRVTFWSQPKVIEEFTMAVRDRLGCAGSLSEIPAPVSQSNPAQFMPETSGRPRKAWFSRKQDGQFTDPTGTTGEWNLGWRAEKDDKSQERPLAKHEIRVTANSKDLAFRTESNMGILETKTVPCLVLQIDIGPD